MAGATALAAKLHFESGKADLPLDGAAAISMLADAANAGSLVVISGFHDASGDPALNAELARQRAFAVSEARKAVGVAEARIELKKPEQVNAGDEAEARRVEVSVR